MVERHDLGDGAEAFVMRTLDDVRQYCDAAGSSSQEIRDVIKTAKEMFSDKRMFLAIMPPHVRGGVSASVVPVPAGLGNVLWGLVYDNTQSGVACGAWVGLPFTEDRIKFSRDDAIMEIVYRDIGLPRGEDMGIEKDGQFPALRLN